MTLTPTKEPQWLLDLIKQETELSECQGKFDFTRYEMMEKDPNILKHYQDYIRKTVKFDEHTKNIVFFTALSAMCADYDNKLTPLNLFLKGDSGSGKTYNVMETIKFFDPNDLWLLGALSPKALVYQYGELLDEENRPIDMSERPDKNKPRKRSGESDETYADRLGHWEADKLRWNERMKRSKYVVDLSGKILVFLEAPQEETFLMLRPILSHDAKEISFRMATKEGGNILTKNVVLRGWCATIFCTTQVEFLEELSTRSFTASPMATTEKIGAGIDLVGKRASMPFLFHKDYEFEMLHGYLSIVSSQQVGNNKLLSTGKGKNFRVINPFGKHFAEKYPSREVRAMRDIQHVLALMNISAMFHFKQRPFLTIGENDLEKETWLMVTAKDFEIVAEFIPKIGETTLSGLPQTALDVFEKVVKPLACKQTTFNYNELVDKYNEEFTKKRSYSYIRDIMKGLMTAGYVTSEKDPEDKRKINMKILRNPDNPFKIAFKDFLGSFSETDFKNWFEDCKNYSQKQPVLMNTQNPEKTIETDDDLNEVFQNHYIIDSEKIHQFIPEDITPICQNNTIDAMFKQLETSTKNLDEKNPEMDFVKAEWLNVDKRVQDICFSCKKDKKLIAEATTFDHKKVKVCEDCFTEIIDKLYEDV